MAEFTEVHAQRLLNVAKALRESPKPDDFTMETYMNECGTPACAFGHYCARPDLQDAFALRRFPAFPTPVPVTADAKSVRLEYWTPSVLDHFGLRSNEAEELFRAPDGDPDDDEYDYDPGGCGGANTANEAAAYIEAFVARKRETRS